MNLIRTTARRTVLAAAVASTALLLPAIALAASAGPSVAPAAAAARCYRADLTSWVGEPGGVALGTYYYQLEISNISHRACTLHGYPGVSALTHVGGGQLGSAANREPGHAVRTVTLAPLGTAHVILQITDVGNYPPGVCHQANAEALRVYAPGDYAASEFSFNLTACANKGPVFLHASPVLAGTGIPQYSN